ncbi:MAG: VWA domain-containing protein [Planctomycetes bacterium]|nr:VWA domain-containing protein [Planctomycetota bacterium]
MKNDSAAMITLSSLCLLASTVTRAPAARAETDWVLVLDRSESMIQNDPYNCRFDAQKILVDLLAQGVEETHRLTIIRFSGTPEAALLREPIRPERIEAIRKTIAEDPPQGDTDIGAALAMAREVSAAEGRASDVRVILLSDGVQAGKIANLAGRLDEETKACRDLGLAVHTILLNDFSIPAEEREARRRRKAYYEDRQLQAGADLLREVARATGGLAAEVRPERGIEDILLELLSPYFSFHRQPVASRVDTFPTDRQLFLFLDRKARDVRLRIGPKELDLSLEREAHASGDFEVTVSPYRNRTVVLVRPAEDVRWPERVEVLPGPSGNALSGDVFVISNALLEAVPGLDGEDAGPGAGMKARVRENELYPVRFELEVASDITPDRARSVLEAVKRCRVRIELAEAGGKVLEEKDLSAADLLSGGAGRLYFLPTRSPRGETKVQEPFSITVRATLEGAAGKLDGRPLCRAPVRTFVVEPSSFEWVLRKNWKGEPESASRPVLRREVELELGQELRLEIRHGGRDPLGPVAMTASYSRSGEGAATRLALEDSGGVPRLFHTDWIFPPEPGLYEAKARVKSDGVQEVAFSIRVLRDDWRTGGSEYGRDGTDTAKGRDLGSWYKGERVVLTRARTLNRLTAEATAKYWEAEAASPVRVHLLRRDAGGAWTVAGQVPLAAEPPRLGTPEVVVTCRGEVSDLEPGDYLAAWPEKRPLGADPATDQRCDRFAVLGPAYAAGFSSADGKPLAEPEGGKPTLLAGTTIVLTVVPTEIFPKGFAGAVTGTLTWARKNAEPPRAVTASRRPDGAFVLELPTTDFDTGPARLRLAVSWKEGDRDRTIEEGLEVFSRTKALGVTVEPLEETVLLGQRGAALHFRLKAVGGPSAQAQRDLLSVWQSQPATATVDDSEQAYPVELTSDGGSLEGSLAVQGLAQGTHKLVVSSPVAKLGQDSGACFFNVRPCPFAASLFKASLGAEEQAVLGPGVEHARCEGEGGVWVAIEPGGGGEAGQAPKVVSADLALNGKRASLRWSEAAGRLRSEPMALEALDRSNALGLTVTDDAGRVFDLSLGRLEVTPVPLKHDVAWAKAPPAVLGRGEHVRIQGAIHVRGGLREEREGARHALEKPAAPWLVASPASVLEGFQTIEGGGAAGGPRDLFGESVAFAATLRVAAASPELKDSFALTVLVPPGAAAPGGEAGAVVEQRKVAIGPSSLQLNLGRAGEKGEVAPPGPLPFLARERIRLTIEGAVEGGATLRIRVHGPDAATGQDAVVASADAAELDWSPRRDGAYRVAAEAARGDGSGWAAEETLNVLPPLKLEWTQAHGGSLKLDQGQKLALALKVLGPPALDGDAFERWFALRPEVLGEGGQPLAVELTGWEAEGDAQPGSVALVAYSAKPLTPSAARARVHLVPRGDADAGAALDVLTLELVRGGGSLVSVEGFERGPQGYQLTDLAPGFQLPRGGRIRFGYRFSGSLEAGESLRSSVAAIIVDGSGAEKVLDVDAASRDLVVFTPYEAPRYGSYTLRLEVRGKTPLLRDLEFEVVKGASEWAYAAALGGAGAVLLALLAALGVKGLAYRRDRRAVLERVNARKEKAFAELEAEPLESLAGSVRLTVASQSLGPLELNGSPSAKDVDSWVDQHFSADAAIFSDAAKNARRRDMIAGILNAARTELCLETERRLPIRGADICVRDVKEPGSSTARLEARIVHDVRSGGAEGLKPLLSLRLLSDGKLRIATASGRSVTLSPGEDFPYNGWIGKSGNQIRASVKVPGVADYSTLIIDLKA